MATLPPRPTLFISEVMLSHGIQGRKSQLLGLLQKPSNEFLHPIQVNFKIYLVSLMWHLLNHLSYSITVLRLLIYRSIQHFIQKWNTHPLIIISSVIMYRKTHLAFLIYRTKIKWRMLIISTVSISTNQERYLQWAYNRISSSNSSNQEV